MLLCTYGGMALPTCTLGILAVAMTPSSLRGQIIYAFNGVQAAAPPGLLRCMEEMGDWAKVLEVIDSENAETAAADGESAAAAEVSDERLFLREDGWDGPKFLRCSQKETFPLTLSHACMGSEGRSYAPGLMWT